MDDVDDEGSVVVTGEGNDVAVVRVTGDVDIMSVDPIREAVEQALTGGATTVVFDLSAVDFMDSSGIAALIETSSRAQSVWLRAPSMAVQRLIDVTGLASVLRSEP